MQPGSSRLGTAGVVTLLEQTWNLNCCSNDCTSSAGTPCRMWPNLGDRAAGDTDHGHSYGEKKPKDTYSNVIMIVANPMVRIMDYDETTQVVNTVSHLYVHLSASL